MEKWPLLNKKYHSHFSPKCCFIYGFPFKKLCLIQTVKVLHLKAGNNHLIVGWHWSHAISPDPLLDYPLLAERQFKRSPQYLKGEENPERIRNRSEKNKRIWIRGSRGSIRKGDSRIISGSGGREWSLGFMVVDYEKKKHFGLIIGKSVQYVKRTKSFSFTSPRSSTLLMWPPLSPSSS